MQNLHLSLHLEIHPLLFISIHFSVTRYHTSPNIGRTFLESWPSVCFQIPCCESQQVKRFLSSPQHSDQLWGPPSLLFNGYSSSFEWQGRGEVRWWPGHDADHLSPFSTKVASPVDRHNFLLSFYLELMKIQILDKMPCSLVCMYQHFWSMSSFMILQEPEDGGSRLIEYIGICIPIYTVSYSSDWNVQQQLYENNECCISLLLCLSLFMKHNTEVKN